MSHRRDRHDRGLRGPLARPNGLTGIIATPPQPATKAEFFADAVRDSLDRIGSRCPSALTGVMVGVEDVPVVPLGWAGDRVPLALAVDATADAPGRVVVYRRPLEHRAASRRGLRILVHRTVVEQLSALTGLSVDQIDPDAADPDD